jgi:hypothetical protein
MKQLPKFINTIKLDEKEGLYELVIILHYKEKNKPYNRLSHLIIKDWIYYKLGRKVDPATFEGPNIISNKTGANIGRWTFTLLEESREKPKSKKTKKANKKTAKKEEKELDKYEEMTYPLPSKD